EAVAVYRKIIDANRNELHGAILYNAACAVAMAGCSQGKDAATLNANELALLRNQALTWLRAGLTGPREWLDKNRGKSNPTVREMMQRRQQDSDFNGVRGDEALAKLPEAERQEWQKLWQEVEEL